MLLLLHRECSELWPKLFACVICAAYADANDTSNASWAQPLCVRKRGTNSDISKIVLGTSTHQLLFVKHRSRCRRDCGCSRSRLVRTRVRELSRAVRHRNPCSRLACLYVAHVCVFSKYICLNTHAYAWISLYLVTSRVQLLYKLYTGCTCPLFSFKFFFFY